MSFKVICLLLAIVAVHGASVDVTLTSSEVKNLMASPKTLIAAQGAGVAVQIINMQSRLNYGGTSAFVANNNLGIFYKDCTGTAPNTGLFVDTGVLTNTVNYITQITGYAVQTAASNVENQPILLCNLGEGDISGNAAGDNTVTVHLEYNTITAP